MNSIIQQFLNTIKASVPAMSETDLSDLAKELTVTQYKAKEAYLSAGQLQTHAGYIVQGLARICYINEKGEDLTVNFFSEGQFMLNFLAFKEEKPSHFAIQCLENTMVINFPIPYIKECFDRNTHIAIYFYQQIEKSFLDFIKRTESLLFESAEERYLNFIKDKPSLLPRVPVSHLCSYLGMERQTLTRIRKKMVNKAF